MLTVSLMALASSGAEWVLWLLFLLSAASIGVVLDRALYFGQRRLPGAEALMTRLVAGDFAGVQAAVGTRTGMEAEVIRTALAHVDRGPEAVSRIVDAEIVRARLGYEARLSFLGTLGNNAPFLGLFGTVLGVIHAFAALGAHPGADGASMVMVGISEALIATAVGLFVALPAVVAFNFYQRWLRRTAQRANMLGRAIEARLLGTKEA